MRINLVTPFAERDAVKALGARWDSAMRTWYISDVADLTPFLRWIPEPQQATAAATNGTPQRAASTAPSPIEVATGTVTGACIALSHCGCNVLPWEDCEHTTRA